MNLRLIQFLYTVARKLPREELEAMVLEAEKIGSREKYSRLTKKRFEDQPSAVEARKIAERLLKKDASEKHRRHLDGSRPT